MVYVKFGKRLDLVSLHECARIVEIAAVPLAVLVVVAVAVCGKRLRLRTISLRKVAGDVGRGLLLHEGHDARVAGKVLHLPERRLPLALRPSRKERQ